MRYLAVCTLAFCVGIVVGFLACEWQDRYESARFHEQLKVSDEGKTGPNNYGR